MPTLTDTSLLEGMAVVWTAEFRIDRDNVILEWIRTRTKDGEFTTHWPVDVTIVDGVRGGELTNALRASIDHQIAAKYASRHVDRRTR